MWPDLRHTSAGASHNPIPSRHDAVTMACPVCRTEFTPRGRRRYCTDACKAIAYRRRRDDGQPELTIPNCRPPA